MQFCSKLGQPTKETYDTIKQSYGDASTSCLSVKLFPSGKARMSKFKVKTMLLAIFNHRGIIHKEFYAKALSRLPKRYNCVRSDIDGSWKLHHDNAPCHTDWLDMVFTGCLAALHGAAKLSSLPWKDPCFFSYETLASLNYNITTYTWQEAIIFI